MSVRAWLLVAPTEKELAALNVCASACADAFFGDAAGGAAERLKICPAFAGSAAVSRSGTTNGTNGGSGVGPGGCGGGTRRRSGYSFATGTRRIGFWRTWASAVRDSIVRNGSVHGLKMQPL